MENGNNPPYTPLYFKEADTSSPQALVNSLFYVYGSHSYGFATFNDEALIELQCPKGKIRSFNDVYDIVNTYFPGTSPKEVFKLVILSIPSNAMLDEKNLWLPQLGFCNDMGRIRIRHIQNAQSIYIARGHASRNGIAFEWESLYQAAGFADIPSVIAFVLKNRSSQNA